MSYANYKTRFFFSPVSARLNMTRLYESLEASAAQSFIRQCFSVHQNSAGLLFSGECAWFVAVNSCSLYLVTLGLFLCCFYDNRLPLRVWSRGKLLSLCYWMKFTALYISNHSLLCLRFHFQSIIVALLFSVSIKSHNIFFHIIVLRFSWIKRHYESCGFRFFWNMLVLDCSTENFIWISYWISNLMSPPSGVFQHCQVQFSTRFPFKGLGYCFSFFNFWMFTPNCGIELTFLH